MPPRAVQLCLQFVARQLSHQAIGPAMCDRRHPCSTSVKSFLSERASCNHPLPFFGFKQKQALPTLQAILRLRDYSEGEDEAACFTYLYTVVKASRPKSWRNHGSKHVLFFNYVFPRPYRVSLSCSLSCILPESGQFARAMDGTVSHLELSAIADLPKLRILIRRCQAMFHSGLS